MNRMITGKKRAFSSLSCKQIGSGRVREREGERAGERERERERVGCLDDSEGDEEVAV